MAFTYGFYDAMNHDRRYNADQMDALFDGIVNDGVLPRYGNKLTVSAGSGMKVVVGTGKAWFNHTWNELDSALTLNIDASDPSLKRIDAVVLEVNSGIAVRSNEIKIIKGVTSSNPEKPKMANEVDLHQYPLAYVTINNAATSLSAANIQNVVGTSECPYMSTPLVTLQDEDVKAQWNEEFEAWFDDLQMTLSTHPVTEIQRQIDYLKRLIQAHWVDTLSDGTKDDFGLGANATPDDAFRKMQEFTDVKFEVGDIRISLKTSLGENWLRCDGSKVDQSQYPDLYKLKTTLPNISAVQGIAYYYIKAK